MLGCIRACGSAPSLRDSFWGAGVVDACLIPEVPFALKGTKGLFAYIEKVLEERGHCVMCIAEGAGQVSFKMT